MAAARGNTSRRGFLATGAAAAAAAGLGAAGAAAPAAEAATPGHRRVEYVLPTLAFDASAVQDELGTVYDSALTDVVGINTTYAVPATYDKAGLVSYPPGTLVRAGGGYPEPQRWTRDAAINAWSAVSLLGPSVGRNTLWSVVDPGKGDDGPVVQQDNQWWDQIVWAVGAWNHYLVTGDHGFLEDAYGVASRTLALRKAQNLNTSAGLFQGPGYMNDGIAGYPAPPWTPGIDSSFVLDYPHTDELMVLSTNCLYHGAHLALEGMATALGHHAAAAGYRRAAASLRSAIDRHLWREDAGTYGYLVHGGDAGKGRLDTSQEGAGLALAVLFGVADRRRTRLLLDGAHWQPHGIVNVWPHFERFSDDRPGRHNVMVWPMVHSLFGHAAAQGGRTDLFARAVTELAALVKGTGGSFYELYHSVTGKVDGGWQTGGSGTLTHFDSQPDQAWSATGYLRLIHHGLFGLRPSADGLRFAPSLPEGWGDVRLQGLAYRDMTLDIELTGAGDQVHACMIDGRRARTASLPAHGGGHHTVRIALAGS
ncbi:MGH1-like glycoside hydrolase domain-containing protein [Streptomyces sp. NRRL F-5126]|uniref:MGH1-like glycoside hydrolase domain-containing protein n=1 Tax=Streptomyces sp. NRRL F-5126 TaxID=1463857 RepID=UPI0004C99084|nr:glycosyl hydrolase family 65 protein [Streptomyces sp. NRRL F-5126]